jgi:SpoIID/LytB domain protein
MSQNPAQLRLHRLFSSAAAAVAVVAVIAGSLVLTPLQVGAADDPAPDVITVHGRGWGHGRGLSQYGALGYAVDHGWGSAQILDHYYGNTTGTEPIANDDIVVHLTALDSSDLLVTSSLPFVVEGIDFVAGEIARIQVRGVSSFAVLRSAGCADLGTEVAAGLPGVAGQNDHPFVEALPSNVDPSIDDVALMLEAIACNDDNIEISRRAYRGALRFVEISGVGYSLNRLPIEQYLRGVVPRESPTWWGGLGGGKGIAALEAQAVAARSYAAALAINRESRGFASGTCDTTACQVYGGASVNGLPLDHGEIYTHSNAAVLATAGLVRRYATGAVAFTEFSSSSGGWTVPISERSPFPDVADLGDAISLNPNAEWTDTISRSSIESQYPALGTLIRIDVTGRNGLGAWGGRTRQITLEGTDANVVVDIDNWGDDSFRRAFGLKSDWYQFPDFPAEPGEPPPGIGFWLVKSEGTVLAFGGAAHYGDASDLALNKPIVGMAATPSGLGYWLVASDGGIFTFGDAGFHGSAGDIALNEPIVGMSAHPDGNGYWFVAADGGVFTFGSAAYLGSMGAVPLNEEVVAMEATPTGAGYWLVAADGGVFTFGDAQFLGGTGHIRLNEPITGLGVTASGDGYWFVAIDGGVFTFGDAQFLGSRGSSNNHASVVGLGAVPGGGGYWLLLADGTSYPFGNAPDYISSVAGQTVVGIASVPAS